jgi:hypothetical protein
MHHRGIALPHIQPKIFDIYSDSVSIRLPCSAINSVAYGGCIHYLDEFDDVQATKCFGMPEKQIPSINGAWSSWEDRYHCSAPCSLSLISRSIVEHPNVDYLNGKSDWSFQRRTCSNPHRLGKGADCHPDKQITSNSMVEYDISQETCESPWQLAMNNIQTINKSEKDLNCECGCSRTGAEGGAIFSPAPWQCKNDDLKWEFECEDCEFMLLDVHYYGIGANEGVFITELKASKNETFKIDSTGSTQHIVQKGIITYKRSENSVGCGFALKVVFNRPLIIPIAGPKNSEIVEEKAEANIGMWGILVCAGFIILLIIASVFNCRSSDKEGNNPVSTSPDFQQYSQVDIVSNTSPTKLRPTAACFSLAQQQLRLMKAEGKNTGYYLYCIIIHY